MSFVAQFFLLVVFLSTTELLLLVRVSAQIGFLPTLALCVLTGVVGGALVRHQGLQTLRRVQLELASGRLPADELLDGLALIVLGALLCVPGFITDVLGFLLLVPPLRRGAIGWVKRRFSARMDVRVWPQSMGRDALGREPADREDHLEGEKIIDVDFEMKSTEDKDSPRP